MSAGAEAAPPEQGERIERVFVVVPAYNAGATVEQVFARIPPEARARVRRYVVLDDGSTDDTRAALERVARAFPGVDVLSFAENRGYGATEKELLRHALAEGAEAVVLLHADGQYSPEKMLDLLAPLDRGEADLVQGSRMRDGHPLKGGMPLYKFVANRCLTALENRAFGLRLAEYHSGYLAYSRALLEGVPFERLSDSFDFDLDMIVLARIAGFRIREVPIPTIYADEVSHLSPVRYGLDVLSTVRRYRRGEYHRLFETANAEAGA